MAAPDLDRLLEHSQWLRPMARALVHDEHLAEDVLQETYIAALNRPPREAPLGAWLSQVLRNVVRMQARKEGRRVAREERVARRESEPASEPSASDLLELRLELTHALLELREPYRSTLILRFYDDLSPNEIALAEGIPAATVRVRLKRGLDELRDRFERRGRRGLIALLLIADWPGVDAASLWETGLLAEAAVDRVRSTALPASSSRLWIGVAAPLMIALFLIFLGIGDPSFGGGGLADPKSSDVWGEHRFGAVFSAESSTVPEVARHRSPAAGAGGRNLESSSSSDGILPTAPLSDPVTLVVFDSWGTQVSGAIVESGERRLSAGQIATGFETTAEFLLASPTPFSLGTTDSSGELRVERSILATDPISVRAPGHRTLNEGATARALPHGRHEVTLRPAAQTVVSVIGEGGRRVEACQVEVIDSRGVRARTVLESGAQWSTALESRVELIRCIAPGFAAVEEYLTAPEHTVELVGGSPAIGRVVDRLGQPVVGATVAMRSERFRGPPAITATDRFGLFETIALESALSDRSSPQITLTIDHPNFAPRAWEGSPTGGNLGVIALETAHTLSGQITDPSGLAVPGARVLLAPATDTFLSRDVIELACVEDGRFEIPRLASGAYLLRAEAVGHAFAERRVTLPAESTPVTVALRTPTTVSGTIRDETGVPVAGVPVKVGAVFGDELRGETTRTDRAGRFTLSGLPEAIIRHRPRRRVFRFTALPLTGLPLTEVAEGTEESASDLALLELFLPHQLLRVNGTEVEHRAHFGSRNTALVHLDGKEIEVVIARVAPLPPLTFELVSPEGDPIVAFTNVLIASPAGWTMKDFAGLDGQPFHLPNPWVLDDAEVTVMSRGFPWTSARLDLRRSNGVVRFVIEPPFDAPPTLTLHPPEVLELLVAPLLGGRPPLAALPIGATDPMGALQLETLGPGRYQLFTPRDPSTVYRADGRRRTAIELPQEGGSTIDGDLIDLGTIEITHAEHQHITRGLRSAPRERNDP